jgi:hypothetical protein
MWEGGELKYRSRLAVPSHHNFPALFQIRFGGISRQGNVFHFSICHGTEVQCCPAPHWSPSSKKKHILSQLVFLLFTFLDIVWFVAVVVVPVSSMSTISFLI